MAAHRPIPTAEERTPAPRRRLKFGIGGLLLIMLVCSVMASAGYYLVESLGVGSKGFRLTDLNAKQMSPQLQLGFMLFTLAAPVVLVVIASVTYSVLRWLRRG